MMEMSGLTDVARVCKPLDVHAHVQPPETFYKMRAGGICTTMTYLIMCLSEKPQPTTRGNDYLVFSMRVLAPEVIRMYEEA